MWYWFWLIWIPFGKLYIEIWKLWRAGVTLWDILTKKQYHIMIVETGAFGYSTPLFHWLVRRKRKGEKDNSKYVLMKGA